MKPIGISAVIVLAAWTLFFSLAPMRGLFWLHPASLGVTADSSMRVTEVDSPGPAYRAGIRVGDRFDAATSFEKRLFLQPVRNAAPGWAFAFQVEGKNGSLRTVNLVAEMEEFDASDILGYFPWVLADLIFVVSGLPTRHVAAIDYDVDVFLLLYRGSPWSCLGVLLAACVVGFW